MEPKVDFSKFSKVQASLKERLMAKYDEKQQLADDELDMVAAARGFSSLDDSSDARHVNFYKPGSSKSISLDDSSHTWQQRHKDRGIWR